MRRVTLQVFYHLHHKMRVLGYDPMIFEDKTWQHQAGRRQVVLFGCTFASIWRYGRHGAIRVREQRGFGWFPIHARIWGFLTEFRKMDGWYSREVDSSLTYTSSGQA